MSKQLHTPEPWAIRDNQSLNNDTQIAFIISEEKEIATLSAYEHRNCTIEETNANAARIVACVNHCKGATNEELQARSHEELMSILENEARDNGVYEQEIEKLKAEKDELLDALKGARPFVQTFADYDDLDHAELLAKISNIIKKHTHA